MGEANKLVLDGVAWLGNVSTSVAIIFINKVLMARTGYGFVYGGFCKAQTSFEKYARALRELVGACSHNALCSALPGLLSQHLGDSNIWWGQESQTALPRQVALILTLPGTVGCEHL